MAVAMDAMAVAIHIKYALNQNRYLIHTREAHGRVVGGPRPLERRRAVPAVSRRYAANLKYCSLPWQTSESKPQNTPTNGQASIPYICRVGDCSKWISRGEAM